METQASKKSFLVLNKRYYIASLVMTSVDGIVWLMINLFAKLVSQQDWPTNSEAQINSLELTEVVKSRWNWFSTCRRHVRH